MSYTPLCRYARHRMLLEVNDFVEKNYLHHCAVAYNTVNHWNQTLLLHIEYVIESLRTTQYTFVSKRFYYVLNLPLCLCAQQCILKGTVPPKNDQMTEIALQKIFNFTTSKEPNPHGF